jgi:hypothetical protein
MEQSDADSEATYNELIRGKGRPVMGQNALAQAALRNAAAASAPPGPGQGQLSPMLGQSPQQAMAMQAAKAAAIRRMQAGMPPPLPPQPPMNPGGGLP